MSMLDFNAFKTKISSFNEISSGSVQYKIVRTDSAYVYYKRLDAQNPNKTEKIDLSLLYKFYLNGDYKTTVAKHFYYEEKPYSLSGKQSPSVAIVKSLLN